MASSILDDVKLLLMKKAGDPKILERIKRAAENNEVISIYEREYVGNLARQHLDPALVERKRVRAARKVPTGTKERPADTHPPTSKYDSNYARNYARQETVERKPRSNMKIIIPAAVAAIIAIGVVAVVSLDLMPSSPDDTGPPVSGGDDNGVVDPVDPPPQEPEYTIETDQLSYGQGDIVTISGTANYASGDVNVFLTNSSGELIWDGAGVVTESGSFSLLLLAGGSGWEDAGEYEVVLQQDGQEVRSTFFFIP